jgi:hypothetical protein
LQSQARELQRLLGMKTLEAEILKEAMRRLHESFADTIASPRKPLQCRMMTRACFHAM